MAYRRVAFLFRKGVTATGTLAEGKFAEIEGVESLRITTIARLGGAGSGVSCRTGVSRKSNGLPPDSHRYVGNPSSLGRAIGAFLPNIRGGC